MDALSLVDALHSLPVIRTATDSRAALSQRHALHRMQLSQATKQQVPVHTFTLYSLSLSIFNQSQSDSSLRLLAAEARSRCFLAF